MKNPLQSRGRGNVNRRLTVLAIVILALAAISSAADESEVVARRVVEVDMTESDVALPITPRAGRWRSLHIENTGSTPIDTPDVRAGDQMDLSSTAAIVSQVVRHGMSDAEKARALYQFVVENVRSWALPSVDGATRAMEILNVYGYCNCTGFAATLASLAEAVGLESRIVDLPGHTIAEIYHDAAWHLYDANLMAVYPKPDGTLASVAEVQRDLRLLGGTKHRILAPDGSLTEAGLRRIYAEKKAYPRSPPARNKMRKIEFSLFPEERIEWFRDEGARFFPYQNGAFMSRPPRSYYAGGRLTYRPDLSASDFARRWNHGGENEELARVGGKLSVSRAGVKQHVRMRWQFPWAVVGGRVRLSGYRTPGDGVLRLTLHRAEGATQFLAVVAGQPDFEERFETEVEFTHVAVRPPPAPVPFDVEIELMMFRARAFTRFEIDRLEVEIDLQRSPQSLPPLDTRLDQLVYSDRSDARNARVSVEAEGRSSSMANTNVSSRQPD